MWLGRLRSSRTVAIDTLGSDNNCREEVAVEYVSAVPLVKCEVVDFAAADPADAVEEQQTAVLVRELLVSLLLLAVEFDPTRRIFVLP